jgi:uncharacterized protein (TIGR00730 family)
MQSIVVYCGSNLGTKAIYSEMAYQLGRKLANKNIKLIYGGGNMGLMGRVSDGVMEHEGSATGIIPNFLAELEVEKKTLTELHFVETMHERKAKMVSLSDGVIALPGGFGTLDELFEILTWSQLKIFTGPIGLLNINGFYDHLLAHLDKTVEEGFLHADNRELILVADNVTALLDKMDVYHKTKKENKPLDTSLYLNK